MTEDERLAFFNTVKHKKIRWSTWNNSEYFIPRKFEGLVGIGIEGDHSVPGEVYKTSMSTMEGFAPDSTGDYWEFCKKQEISESSGPKVCDCEKDLLFAQGCKCGAFVVEMLNKERR